MRCVLESLALRYRQAYLSFADIGKKAGKLFIVGGGVQNKLLCKFTANALGIPVLTGPVEATAVGKILIQLDTLGEVSGREQMIEIIRDSFELEEYYPQDFEQWTEAAERFDKLYRK